MRIRQPANSSQSLNLSPIWMTLKLRLTATAAGVALSVMLSSIIISLIVQFTIGVLSAPVILSVKKLWPRCA